MDEVVELAAQVQRLSPALDGLVNNAGLYPKKRFVTADGFELTMAVNHLAPFLLTARLMPLLAAAPSARIVNVSSMTHSGARLDTDDLDLTQRWDAYGAYATSKLANILFTIHLAGDLAGSAITANALHPGVIGTKLLRAGFGMGGGTPTDGARTSVYLIDSAAVARISGRYFVDCREAAVSAQARDSRLAEALWYASADRLARFL
jgi:NAD(P)-dependent dehydrogenase (short-subunit alcohol dehydrogenase family)